VSKIQTEINDNKKREYEQIWSLTLREEHRLRVFENRILKGKIWTEEG
jgi:hypothetical protein